MKSRVADNVLERPQTAAGASTLGRSGSRSETSVLAKGRHRTEARAAALAELRRACALSGRRSGLLPWRPSARVVSARAERLGLVGHPNLPDPSSVSTRPHAAPSKSPWAPCAATASRGSTRRSEKPVPVGTSGGAEPRATARSARPVRRRSDPGPGLRRRRHRRGGAAGDHRRWKPGSRRRAGCLRDRTTPPRPVRGPPARRRPRRPPRHRPRVRHPRGHAGRSGTRLRPHACRGPRGPAVRVCAGRSVPHRRHQQPVAVHRRQRDAPAAARPRMGRRHLRRRRHRRPEPRGGALQRGIPPCRRAHPRRRSSRQAVVGVRRTTHPQQPPPTSPDRCTRCR